MSTNNVPEIRAIFKDCRIEIVDTSYSATGVDRKKHVQGLLVMNY